MFALPNAGEVILSLVKQGASFDYQTDNKIFELENREEILSEYVKHSPLCNETQVKIISELSQSDAAKILLAYVKAKRRLGNKAQCMLFALPGGKEILLEYVKTGRGLCREAQIKIFELEDRENFLLKYFKAEERLSDRCVLCGRARPFCEKVRLFHGFYDEAESKIFELKNREEILLEHIKKEYPLCYESELKIFALKNREEILLEYVKNNSLNNAIQIRIISELSQSGTVEIMSEYIKHWVLCPEAQKLYKELAAKG